MQLTPDRLSNHLQTALMPVYLVAGEEPLQAMEAADAIRAAARAKGYTEREVFNCDGDFQWMQLLEHAANLSLFAERRLLELRSSSGKFGKEGGAALEAFLRQMPEDLLLLISAGKLEKATKNTAWFKAVERAGAVVQVWPLPRERMAAWLTSRAGGMGLRLAPASVTLLLECTEGNLLAAAQELEKLRLLYGEGALEPELVARAVADSARFSIYDLADAALVGDAPRALRILQGLREEGEDAILILWAVTRELRVLAQIKGLLASGLSQATALQRANVWKQRVSLVQTALRRNLDWALLLQQAARLDRLIKGQGAGNFWSAMERLLLAFSGKALFKFDLEM